MVFVIWKICFALLLARLTLVFSFFRSLFCVPLIWNWEDGPDRWLIVCHCMACGHIHEIFLDDMIVHDGGRTACRRDISRGFGYYTTPYAGHGRKEGGTVHTKYTCR
ncbi:hypothetical protein V8F06_001437 [Rhypophila decipiens]